MATLDGENVFGLVESCPTDNHPEDRQVNTFPAINGVEVLSGGLRGDMTHLSGVMSGEGTAGLAENFAILKSYRDARAHVFVDTLGDVYPQALMNEVHILGSVGTGSDGTCVQKYTVSFFQLRPRIG